MLQRNLRDRLALPPAVFVGNSVGGYAAARLALDHPQPPVEYMADAT